MHIVVVFPAPIPVGHRARITWLQKVERGLVPGQERREDRPHQPRIEDLDTGVVYETDWGLGHGGRSLPDAPHEVSDQPLHGFSVQRQVQGVVRSCRVITIRDSRTMDLQTHLELDEQA